MATVIQFQEDAKKVKASNEWKYENTARFIKNYRFDKKKLPKGQGKNYHDALENLLIREMEHLPQNENSRKSMGCILEKMDMQKPQIKIKGRNLGCLKNCDHTVCKKYQKKAYQTATLEDDDGND